MDQPQPDHPAANSTFQYGPQFIGPEQVRFSVWAKSKKRMTLELRQAKQVTQHKMRRDDDGFFSVTLDGIRHGDDYRFQLNRSTNRPDPAAHFYTHDVHGWCKVIDHSRHQWEQNQWQGISKQNLVIYELHIGTFTQRGTFLSTIERLDELVDLGVTAVELLPVSQCPGRWNWGYDGVGLFSVSNNYGTPDHLKQLVDACHARGLAIILDVVYNHLGPEGNYLSDFGPYFTTKHHTPWGSALNFDDTDCRYVRQFMLANVAYWIQQYRFDGLRLDAVNFMFDDSEKPMSIEIAESFNAIGELEQRQLHLIGETNAQHPGLVKSTSPHGTGFDLVWSDCIMHSLLNVAQPGLDVCHRDHSKKTDPGLALHQGFLYEGFPYQRHDRGQRGDLNSFVIGLQNHDTVGNHPLGKRIQQLGCREFHQSAAALYLLYPAVPMLFMGEEFACEHPFLFFVEFGDPHVRDSVEKGRASEFPEMHKTTGVSPLDPQTFHQSKIGAKTDGDVEIWDWYQQLITLRKRFLQSGLLQSKHLRVESDADAGLFQLIYEDAGQKLAINVRLTKPNTPCDKIELANDGEILLATHDDAKFISANQTVVTYSS